MIDEPRGAFRNRSSIILGFSALALSWTITHCFGVPKRFPWLLNPKVRLRVGHQHSKFWPILARFMDNYSLFWGPGVISTIDESRGAFTCRSSTLAFFADSGPFSGLLLTFWGPGVISTIDEPRGAFTCRSSTLAVLADSGSFCGLLLTFWGPGVISTIDEPRDAFTCRSSTLAILADSGPFCELLLSVLGSRSDFHD